MRKIEQGTVAVSLDEKSLMVTLEQEKTKWSWEEGFRPYMECEEGELFFDEAASISHETYQTGIGVGIRSIFSDFEKEGKYILVSAGLGEHTIPVRIHNPRELLIIELEGTGS